MLPFLLKFTLSNPVNPMSQFFVSLDIFDVRLEIVKEISFIFSMIIFAYLSLQFVLPFLFSRNLID